MNQTGMLLSDDLLFISRIAGTARDLGLRVIALRTPTDLLKRARKEPPSCVLVDLANPDLKIAELVSALRESTEAPPRVVAYGSHVDVATLRAAREAGCDVVLPRSKFVEELPSALPEWFGVRTDRGSACSPTTNVPPPNA
jgi:CheY-like chemotaxis protein